jgi:hypothetical protein
VVAIKAAMWNTTWLRTERQEDSSRLAAAGDLWLLWAQLGDLPVLAIRSASSDILSPSTFARMQREKPDLVPLTVAARGHVPLLDEAECLATIDTFLARVAYH